MNCQPIPASMGDFMDQAHRRRRELGLSIAEVAREVGVAPTTFARWEAGQSYPVAGPARRIATLLALPFDPSVARARPHGAKGIVEPPVRCPRCRALLADGGIHGCGVCRLHDGRARLAQASPAVRCRAARVLRVLGNRSPLLQPLADRLGLTLYVLRPVLALMSETGLVEWIELHKTDRIRATELGRRWLEEYSRAG